jgi:hypothetical protein
MEFLKLRIFIKLFSAFYFISTPKTTKNPGKIRSPMNNTFGINHILEFIFCQQFSNFSNIIKNS